MRPVTFDTLGTELPVTGALIGLDLGEKTIGVAISDTLRAIATPLTQIPAARFSDTARHLMKLMSERAVCGVIIGLPLNMDGTEGPKCQSARAFARNLARFYPDPDLPIAFWDERWSSVAMNRFLVEAADLSRARRAAVIDRNAAAFILQGALDRLAHGAVL